MFPMSFKSKLVRNLKTFNYFKVVDLGSEYCGVYSKVKGSCFRLDEFKRVEDYFFVCFPGDGNKGYWLSCFLIFPFRSKSEN